MFGENVIVINRELKLNPKNRLILPTETFAEAEDELGLMYDFRRQYLRLYSHAEFLKRLEEYEEAFKTLYNQGKIDARTYRRYRRILYAKLCLDEPIVSSKKRITIPTKVAERLEFKNSIYVVGNDTHLEIYKDEKTYKTLKMQGPIKL